MWADNEIKESVFLSCSAIDIYWKSNKYYNDEVPLEERLKGNERIFKLEPDKTAYTGLRLHEFSRGQNAWKVKDGKIKKPQTIEFTLGETYKACYANLNRENLKLTMLEESHYRINEITGESFLYYGCKKKEWQCYLEDYDKSILIIDSWIKKKKEKRKI